MYDKWNHIRKHSLLYNFAIYNIRNYLLYVHIRNLLLDFLYYQLFLSLIILTVTILFIVNLCLIVLDIL